MSLCEHYTFINDDSKKYYLSSKRTFAKQQRKRNQMCMKLVIHSFQLNRFEITAMLIENEETLFKLKSLQNCLFFFLLLFITLFLYRYFADYLMSLNHRYCVITIIQVDATIRKSSCSDRFEFWNTFFFKHQLRDKDAHTYRKCINVLLKSKQRFLVYDFYQCDANLSNTVRAHCPLIPNNVYATT